MSVKLKTEENYIILMCDLKDGQLAVVVDGSFKGRVVQKFKNRFVSIGLKSEKMFPLILRIKSPPTRKGRYNNSRR